MKITKVNRLFIFHRNESFINNIIVLIYTMTGYIVLITEEVSKSSSEDRKDNIFQNNYNICPNNWQFCVLLRYNYDMLFIGLQIRPRGGCRSHTFR